MSSLLWLHGSLCSQWWCLGSLSPLMVWVRGEPQQCQNEGSPFGGHILKASNGTRGGNPVTRYWYLSHSPLPRTGRVFWRRVPQTPCLLISVSSFIDCPTVYPECSIPTHILSTVREKILYSKVFLNWSKIYNPSYLTNFASPNPGPSPPGSPLTLNSTCFNVALYVPAALSSCSLCCWGVYCIPLNLISKHVAF